jgi:four helix bundle protein
VRDFRTLEVWRLARALGADVYRACAKVTRPDSRETTAPLRRSALAIATNIAEGCSKSSRAETIRCLERSAESAAETERHVIAAIATTAVGRRDGEDYLARIAAIRRMLFALIEHLPP